MVDQTPARLSRGQLTQQLGQSGLERYSGFIFDHLDAPPSGQTWLDIFYRMSVVEPVVNAYLMAVETLASRVQWTMQPPDETPEAQGAADFCDGALHDMDQPWVEILSEIWTELWAGFAPMEQTYKERRGEITDEMVPASVSPERATAYKETYSSRYDDGKIGWAKWSLRSPLTRYKWEFDDNGNVLGMWQMAPPTWKPTLLPMEKMLLFRTTTKMGNPEGHSILRAAYAPWYYKTNIQRIEGIGIERDLAGLPVAEVPFELLRTDATAEEQALLATIFKIVTNIKRDTNEGVVWPLQNDAQGHPLYNLKLLSTGGTRQFDTDKIITRYEQRMAMSMLADFIFVGHESRGSFALIQDKTKLFKDALDTLLNRICGVVNNVAIPRLLRLNGMSTTLAPELTHSDVEDVDIQQLTALVVALSQATDFFADKPELLRHILEGADLPVPASIGAVDDQAGDTSVATPEGDALTVPS